jgi:hypothetical protein
MEEMLCFPNEEAIVRVPGDRACNREGVDDDDDKEDDDDTEEEEEEADA